MEFNIFVLHQDVLILEEVEHVLDRKASLYHNILVGICIPLILVSNGYLISFIFKQKVKKTFMDWLVIFDTILCCTSVITLVCKLVFLMLKWFIFCSLSSPDPSPRGLPNLFQSDGTCCIVSVFLQQTPVMWNCYLQVCICPQSLLGSDIPTKMDVVSDHCGFDNGSLTDNLTLVSVSTGI